MVVSPYELSDSFEHAQGLPYAIVDRVCRPAGARHTDYPAGTRVGGAGGQYVSGPPDARGTAGGAVDRQDYCGPAGSHGDEVQAAEGGDRKSTRLNSSHANISYAV